MSDCIVTLTYGKQTFAGVSNSLTSNILLYDHETGSLMDSGLSANHEGLEAVKGSSIRSIPCGNGTTNHGAWYTKNYHSKEGMVIKLEARSHKRGMPYAHGALFLMLREEAPLIRISCNLLPHRLSRLHEITGFTGCADILSKQDVLDLYPNSRRITRYAYNLMHEEIIELFSIVTLRSPISDKPELLSVKNGEAVFVPKPGRRRVVVKRRKEDAE